uniref:NADH dehydrogenase subunit 4L n=1 Tax=Panagrolaimus davidi TaxID=227884 RepID=A0A914QLX4_9BILA
MVVLALRITQSVELFLIGISIITSITVLRIFYKTPLLHRNLLGLLGMLSGEYSIVMISRIVMIVLSFNNEEYMGMF